MPDMVDYDLRILGVFVQHFHFDWIVPVCAQQKSGQLLSLFGGKKRKPCAVKRNAKTVDKKAIITWHWIVVMILKS